MQNIPDFRGGFSVFAVKLRVFNPKTSCFESKKKAVLWGGAFDSANAASASP